MTPSEFQTPQDEKLTHITTLLDEVLASLPPNLVTRSENFLQYLHAIDTNKLAVLHPSLTPKEIVALQEHKAHSERASYVVEPRTMFGAWIKKLTQGEDMPSPDEMTDPSLPVVDIKEPIVCRREGFRITTGIDSKGYYVTSTSFSGNFSIGESDFQLDINNPVITIDELTYNAEDFNEYMYPVPERQFVLVPSLGAIYIPSESLDVPLAEPVTDMAKKSVAVKSAQHILNNIKTSSDPRSW